MELTAKMAVVLGLHELITGQSTPVRCSGAGHPFASARSSSPVSSCRGAVDSAFSEGFARIRFRLRRHSIIIIIIIMVYCLK